MKLAYRLLIACLFVVMAAYAAAQSNDWCRDENSRRAWEHDPVHDEAMELAHTLESHGFIVECVRSSKQAQLFDGQKGAAVYKTNRGVFEVLILPKGQTFDELKIVTESKGEDTIYSFRGKPLIPSTMESKSRIAFIKHDNVMFEVSGNDSLAKSLEQVFQNR